MKRFTTTLSEGGRIVIPAECRKALDLHVGDDVILSLEDRQIRLSGRKQALRKAQEYVQTLVKPGVSLAGELIRERRRQAARE